MISHLAQLHENERVVAAAGTVPGRLAVWAAAVALLAWHESELILLAAVTAVAIDPARRRALLSLAAVGVVVAAGLDHWRVDPGDLVGAGAPRLWLAVLGGAAAFLGALYLATAAALRFERWPAVLRRYPVLTVHVGVWILLAASTLPHLAALTGVALLAWRLSYLVKLASRGKMAGTRFRDHLFYLMPVFGGNFTPYGKGLDFLSRHEARDPAAFAGSQLAGLKLLLLATVWAAVQVWMDGPEDMPGLGPPGLADQLRVDLGLSVVQRWRLVFEELIRETLGLAVTGHVIVGSLRLFGFNVFRNTYKPLLAESVLDFWNRFFFYFKEILVEFFFYPTYLRLRSYGLRVRLFAAVFAAAFVGNVYYHLLTQLDPILRLDLAQLWDLWGARLVYCFLLALGIAVSMLRQRTQRRSPETPPVLVRIRRIAGVWIFYALIQIWNAPAVGVGSLQRLDFFLSLFGL